MHWEHRCFQKDEKKCTRPKRSPTECIHYLGPLCLARLKMKNNRSFYTTSLRKKNEMGQKKWKVRESELQETPNHSPVLPLIYLPLLPAGLLRVRQYYHIVLLNTMWASLLLSLQTAIAYLQRQFAKAPTRLKRPIEAPLDEIWSCQRVCLSIHECGVSGYNKCIFVPIVCVCNEREFIFLPLSCIVFFLWRLCVGAHVALCLKVLFSQ